MNIETAREIFDGLKGGTFVGLDTETEVKLTGGKKNPLQGRVHKVMTGAVVMSFANAKSNAYENMVRRRLEAEGKDPSFEVAPRAWGERIPGTPFVEHKGEHYLEVIFLRVGRIQYTVDGKPIDPSEIVGLPQKSSGGEQGGLDNKVQIRTFKLSGIKRLAAQRVEVK